MNQTDRGQFSQEDFKQLVVLFAWLKLTRDQNSTKGDIFEPLNELNSCVDEVQGNFEVNYEAEHFSVK